ncbi:Chromate resistance protein ChrB [Clostridium hydrogenum]|uniref:Chromate resistance protein ChrB n=1 Tax=Clostridium hydrogenum TaxID=2855764 RepID=UPI001F1663A1|nr:Chromate resistance protein ChrB [Clostridium hydrogenum]
MSINFLQFTYKIPSEPSKNRVHIWRSLKELGAIYLQQGVTLLPYDEKLEKILKELREEVNSLGGKSTLSELKFLNETDEEDIILEFKEQINKEYIEFQNNCERFIYEINREIENNNFQFSELEENEEELKKLERWYNKICKREYFESENEEKANGMLEKLKLKVQEYSHKVCKVDEEK